jgi:hypothetical protein
VSIVNAAPVAQMARIQISRNATQLLAPLDPLREDFARERCVVLVRFIEPTLLGRIRAELVHAEFAPRTHDGIGAELCMRPEPVLELLHLLVNDPPLRHAFEQITGSRPLGWFRGRVYRMDPSAAHWDSWHTDAVEDRLLGMSVNLSPGRYEGGLFQMREASVSTRLVCEKANTGPGDALLFRLSPTLEHRVTGVTGRVPKIAFAGWFTQGSQMPPLIRPRELARD